MARLTNTLTLLLISYLKFTAVNAVSLPAPTGNKDVGTISIQLTDYSRGNPFAPDPSVPQKFMVSLFYPAKDTKKYPLAPYLPPATAASFELSYGAPNGTLSLAQTNSHLGAPIKTCDDTQVILFSTGFATSRFIYTTFAEDLASHGYLVVAIDHPYDAAIVEFPDGTTALAPQDLDHTNSTIRDALLDMRVKDTLFTLDVLHKNLTRSIPGVRQRLRIKETGMFGHSFGGATTAEAMLFDNRILGGFNFDGSLYGKVTEKGLDRPFAFIGTPSHNFTVDATWSDIWGKLRGWKRSLVLADAEHITLSDFPPLIELLGLDVFFPAEYLESFVGTIDGLRANVILRAYNLAFFDFVLNGKKSKLFDGPSAKYPEISFEK